MRFQSLRLKLTLWYVFILGVLLVAFSGFLYLTLSKSLYRSVDNKLRSLADLIAAESASPTSRFGFGNIDQTLEASMSLRPIGKFIQVLDESGRISGKSDNLRNIHLPISLNALKNASMGLVTFETNRSFRDTPLRIVTLPLAEKDTMRIVQVASSLEDVEDTLNTLLLILMITVPTALILASLGGQFLAHKALKPVDQVTQTARMITSQNLNQRIPPTRVKDEISRLAETFNDMISRLDQSFRQIKQFSSDASHELKTPLTILRGEVEVSLRKVRSPEEYQKVLKSNLEEIGRMTQIVDDLLLLSRADSGQIQLNRSEIDLSEILREMVPQTSLLARGKNLHIEAALPGDEVKILGDRLRIRELFLNLIENAVKYTEEGGSIKVQLRNGNSDSPLNEAEPKPDGGKRFAEIRVTDTGIGMDREDQERIFDRFFRIDKARSREQGGSGLGLSICKWIVQAHQGEITVESELGKGSSFIVRLPLHTG
ncbi:MAG: HAMP domain-containing protein [Deltaproteobacteria bacterium]|nr:MAG: HAMP domain-containing protein [Deltaproteobacteria bacterium]